MPNELIEVNEYLFYEFGYDTEAETDSAPISERWPFELHLVAVIGGSQGERRVYEFTHGDERFFALAGEQLRVMPTAGMTLTDIRRQEQGAAWIARREPIDLDTLQIGENSVPITSERRAAITRLAARAFASDVSVRILEGLFLRATSEYLALVQDENSQEAKVVGDGVPPRPARFVGATAWRRLALTVGEMLEKGDLRE